MASLRKKPSPDVIVASADTADPVAVEINTSPPPALAPEPVAPRDEASEALKRQLAALHQTETLQQQAQAAMQAAQEKRQDWVKSNPLAQQHYQVLNQLHVSALQSGLADSSPAYFDFLNNCLADLDAQRPEAAATHLAKEMQARAAHSRPPEPPQPKPVSHGSIVSAPVSREVPSASGQRGQGKITLSPAHLEAAKIAGVTPQEYARQLIRLNEMKASGEFNEQRG